MSLLQIAEPNQSSKPHKHEYALGIDLGTTRSMVAVVRSGKASLIESTQVKNSNDSLLNHTDSPDVDSDAEYNDTLLPSVVYYGDNPPIVGSKALTYFANDPTNTIISAKRFMGRSLADIKFSHPYTLKSDTTKKDSMPSFVTTQGNITPVEVSAEILRTLKYRAEQALPHNSIQGAVITVPAYFDEAQRQASKDAATLAGIHVLRLLNEPTAAAVAYGLDKSKNTVASELDPSQATTSTASMTASSEHIYLVYDLGGGTFDVSLLKMSDGVFEVLATGGNSALGGDDIDRLIMGWLLQQAGVAPNAITAKQRTQIARQAEAYKQALTTKPTVEVSLTAEQTNAHQWHGTLSREILTQIIKPISKRTLATCEQVLRDAKLDISKIDEVIMVGGSTRMPSIQDAVEAFFHKKPLAYLDPDQVVALGAAQVAHQLIQKDKSNNTLLLDVTPLSLGLETMGGLVEVLIPRNTPIPISKRQTFTTYQDGQTGMVIHVVQGERDTVADCRSLGRFELYGIPPMKAGLARVEVTFAIDANGQLTVSAVETTTGTQSDIHITPSYGLSDEQQEKLLRSGMEYAEQDKLSRSLLETKVEAEREILALRSALDEFQSLLDVDETSQLFQAMYELNQSIANIVITNIDTKQLQALKDDIENKQSKLKPLSDAFASRIMNQSIKTSLAGTHTDDWSE